MAGDPDEQRAVGNLSRLYPVVRLNESLALEAAKLIAEADKQASGAGLSGIDDIDPLVAAVADSVDEPVLTQIRGGSPRLQSWEESEGGRRSPGAVAGCLPRLGDSL